KEAGSDRLNVLPMLQKVGQAAAEPFMPKTREKQGQIRNKMGRAGIYSAQGAKVMKGAQVILTVGGLIAGTYIGMTTGYMLLGVALGGLLGYLAPVIGLNQMIKRNQEALNI